jgi:hypothetical protein
MNTTFRKNILAFTFLLSACGATAISTNAKNPSDKGCSDKNTSVMNIKGRAERTVKSDRAVLKLTLSVSGDCYKELLQKLDHQVEELKKFWMKMGVKSGMIHADNRPKIRISDLEFFGSKKEKYSIQRSIVLTMDDLDMASDVQNKTNVLVEKGFMFSSQSMDYIYSGAAELQKELAKEAILDGQKTAKENAKLLGVNIGLSKVNTSDLACFSTYDNPKLYANGWSTNTNIENKFTVLVDMEYSFKNDGKNPSSEQESGEKDGSLMGKDQ